MTRIALLQMTSVIDPAANAAAVVAAAREAAAGGAAMLFTPEMTNLIDRDRKRAAASTGSAFSLTMCPAARLRSRSSRPLISGVNSIRAPPRPASATAPAIAAAFAAGSIPLVICNRAIRVMAR